MNINIPKATRATPSQQNYIEILCTDLSFNRATRNLNISDIVGRTVSYLDDITVDEARAVIDAFKVIKDSRLR